MTRRTKSILTSTREDMLRRDIAVLKELGFKKRTIQSLPLNIRKIDNFRMRQLDRLKLLLLRNEHLIGNYPATVRKGIVGNDPPSFAQALVLLSPQLKDLMV